MKPKASLKSLNLKLRTSAFPPSSIFQPLGTSIAIADKERKGHDERAEVLEIIGDVDGKTALIVDDFTISAGTLADAADKLVERGAKAINDRVEFVILEKAI